MPDVAAALEFAKLFGFPALCLAVMTYVCWRGASWMGREIIKPVTDDLRGALKAVAPLAVQMRDDVAEIKDATMRVERRQNDHFEICAGNGLTAEQRGKPGLSLPPGKPFPA